MGRKGDKRERERSTLGYSWGPWKAVNVPLSFRKNRCTTRGCSVRLGKQHPTRFRSASGTRLKQPQEVHSACSRARPN